MTTCVVIRNPASRGALDTVTLSKAVDVLQRAGWDVTIAETERIGHATEFARDAAARGVDVAIANGGDGTVNEVVNGIAGSDTALAVLPGGTANVWAGEIGIKKKPMEAIRVALEGERRRVDLGVANGRYFLLMAGVGFDAEIVPRVNPAWKRRIGAASYIVSGTRAIFGATHRHATVVIDGETSETDLYWMLVSNTRSYGGITDIMFRARVDDGLFDVGIMHRGGLRRMIIDGVRVLRKKHEDSANIDYLRVRTVEVLTPGIPVQLDGEAGGETPMRFEIAPLALNVIVPRGLKSRLFAATTPSPDETLGNRGSPDSVRQT
jgi:YegS/Rv2252/BmrU family lipid kinase